jgi:hypothetical protein
MENKRKYGYVSLLNESAKHLDGVKNLVDDLGWDYERMSEGGQKVYKKLCKKLGWTFEWEDE